MRRASWPPGSKRDAAHVWFRHPPKARIPRLMQRAQFRRRLLTLLLILLAILLLARFISTPAAPGPLPTPVQADPTATRVPSATITAIPEFLFTPQVTFSAIPPTFFTETSTIQPVEPPSTLTPTPGPGPTGEPAATATPSVTGTRRACLGYGSARGRFWIVAGCDTLTRISQVTGISLEKLLRANPEITDPNIILPNQRIFLPDR